MDKLDMILQESEGLNHARKRVAIHSMTLEQLTHLFKETLPDPGDMEAAKNGRLLLAEKKCDARKAEMILKTLTEEKTESTDINKARTVNLAKYRPLTALELFEKKKQNQINDNWRAKLRETMSFLKKKEISSTTSDPTERLFNSEIVMAGHARNAGIFAHYLGMDSSLESTSGILKQTIEAIDKIHEKQQNDSTYPMRRGIFRALQVMLERPEFEDYSDIGSLMENRENWYFMVQGSLEFLQEQYRDRNFPKGWETKLEDIDEFVTNNKRYRRAGLPWAHIWVCIRAGFYEIVREICASHKQQTRQFLKIFNTYVMSDNEPDDEHKRSIVNDTEALNDNERFKRQAYMFTLGSDVQPPQDIALETAEDFIFCHIAPHRFSNSNIDSLEMIQKHMKTQSEIAFREGDAQFMRALLSMLCLDFQTGVECLLTLKLFPIESVHVCMALKSAGIWNSPAFSMIIHEFVKLLPREKISLAVDYISMTDNSKLLTAFLLEQDVISTTVNLSGKHRAIEMLQQEWAANPVSVNTLQMLLVCQDYETSVKIFLELSNHITSISIFEAVRAIRLCSVLVTKQRGDIRLSIQSSGLTMAVYTLCQANELPQSERGMLIDACEDLMMSIDNPEYVNEGRCYEAVQIMIHICRALVYFDSGMSTEAMAQLTFSPHLIPFESKYVENSVRWMNADPPILPSSKCVAATAMKVVSYFARDKFCMIKYEQKLEAVMSFLGKISLTRETTKAFEEMARTIAQDKEARGTWRQ